MNRVYVGVDLGSSKFHQVAIDEKGVSTRNREFATSEANLVTAFTGIGGEVHVHLEAGELAPWASEIIRPLVQRVVCSHVGVDAAARFHERIAGPVMMRNTLPPLASNDFVGHRRQ